MNKKLIIGTMVALTLIIVGGAGSYLFVKTKRNNPKSGSEIRTTASPTPEVKFLTYKDQSGKFEFQYPEDWKESSKMDNIAVMFLAPKENPEDKSLEGINVAMQKIEETDYTADKYNAYAKSVLPDTFKDFKVIKEEKTKVDGVDAVSLTFTGVNSDRNIKVQQIYIIKDKFLYILSYTANESSYIKYEEEAMKSLDSFRLL